MAMMRSIKETHLICACKSVCAVSLLLTHTLTGTIATSDDKDIKWQPSLGEQLQEEKTLWANLTRCEGCNKYKPQKAYERSSFEEETLLKFSKELEDSEREDVERYNDQCRRCRAKMLLVVFEKEEEMFEKPQICDEERIGLKRNWKNEEEKQKALDAASCYEEWYATRLNYERWEDVFKRLRI